LGSEIVESGFRVTFRSEPSAEHLTAFPSGPGASIVKHQCPRALSFRTVPFTTVPLR
jgi:hypothetical protein